MAGYSAHRGLECDVEIDGEIDCGHLESRVPTFGLEPHRSRLPGDTMHPYTKLGEDARLDSVCDSGFDSGLASVTSQRDSGLEITSMVDDLHLSDQSRLSSGTRPKPDRDSGLDDGTTWVSAESPHDDAYESVNSEHSPVHPQIQQLFEATDEDGDSQLHLAIIHCQQPIAEHIIDLAPSADYLSLQNALYQTPLHLAVLTNQPRVVRKLIVWGADLEVRDRHGNTALHLACQRGFEVCIRCLTTPVTTAEISAVPFPTPQRIIPQDMDIKNYEGESCLHVTLHSLAPDMQIKVIHYLVNRCGADIINIPEGKSGRTMLHEAVDAHNVPLTQFLLNQTKVRVDACTYGGYTPLRLAYSRGYKTLTQLLLDCDADKSQLVDDYESSDSDTDSMDDISYDDQDMVIAGQPITS